MGRNFPQDLWDQQDLKEENVLLQRGRSGFFQLPEQGHCVCVPVCPLLLVWGGIINNPPGKEPTDSSVRRDTS